MPDLKKAEEFVEIKAEDLVHSAQALIAVSSILQAACDQYATTGQLSVGAVIHAGNVVDNVIEKLGLAEIGFERKSLPF
jgi:hypothetical protein